MRSYASFLRPFSELYYYDMSLLLVEIQFILHQVLADEEVDR